MPSLKQKAPVVPVSSVTRRRTDCWRDRLAYCSWRAGNYTNKNEVHVFAAEYHPWWSGAVVAGGREGKRRAGRACHVFSRRCRTSKTSDDDACAWHNAAHAGLHGIFGMSLSVMAGRNCPESETGNSGVLIAVLPIPCCELPFLCR